MDEKLKILNGLIMGYYKGVVLLFGYVGKCLKNNKFIF